MIDIELRPAEQYYAVQIAAMRQCEARQGKYKERVHGIAPGSELFRHIEGALGEMAFAKAMGIYYSKGHISMNDVGEFEVRTTEIPSGHLVLHKEDIDNRRYYLVTGKDLNFRIVGWLLGADGKQERFWNNQPDKNRPCYWIPQNELRPAERPSIIMA